MLIIFSGTAGQVRETFHTEIHKLDVHGEKHIANMSPPQIPEALRRSSQASARCTISSRSRCCILLARPSWRHRPQRRTIWLRLGKRTSRINIP